jgi:hypothetical protein
MAMNPCGVPPQLHVDLVASALKLREFGPGLPAVLEATEVAAAESAERLAQLELVVAGA